MPVLAIINAKLFDGDRFHDDKAVVIENGKILAVSHAGDISDTTNTYDAQGHILAPGFIDVQVNGGGGVLLNHTPTVEGIRAIMAGHRQFGTTAMLPTLITDTRAKMLAAIAAVKDAIAQNVPGIVGIHLEGPYLNTERKGVHDPNIIRPMEDDAIDVLSSLPNGRIVVTMAPEKAKAGTIAKLTENNVLVCAGHTAGTYNDVQAAIGEGLRGFTHLFNAMSPLNHREPGVAGAAIADENTWCGLIADGFHVHPAAMQIAVRAKKTGKIMLVTDAMPTVGAKNKSFVLGGEEIIATNGRCALADGTLAGSDLDMMSAVKNTVEMIGTDLAEALRMASLYPAEFLKMGNHKGRIKPGFDADFVLFDSASYTVKNTWISGQ
ncbi:N-acetylglucosamine-6-phosphate deacetylase [Thalassospira sp. MCCC 1A01428]|uniref:N-acetylglucosamine-6-phosphate deacetylase n=1 Tax=Thalassospira sp. MCCC 1A01428 TaxID=1470575 RepID=UPI000A1E77CB|nr:N-acetylglucosamine-6-phosphate deacetylase [Thalassospira sp. MCCC 1A01428]OSQ41247.1 N-acetylglucosamine 6-phosphate deacetylase [Thalassospira sp. MCCC 1A01428]